MFSVKGRQEPLLHNALHIHLYFHRSTDKYHWFRIEQRPWQLGSVYRKRLHIGASPFTGSTIVQTFPLWEIDIQCPKSHVTVTKKGKFLVFFYPIHTTSFKRPRYLTQTLKQI